MPRSKELELFDGAKITITAPKTSQWKQYCKALATIGDLPDEPTIVDMGDMANPEMQGLIALLTGLSVQEVEDMDMADYMTCVNTLNELTTNFQMAGEKDLIGTPTE
jgi:crotonobetainyl-CoA:carnitine CoA-transferase CaiB-like acyl-CoA transferase